MFGLPDELIAYVHIDDIEGADYQTCVTGSTPGQKQSTPIVLNSIADDSDIVSQISLKLVKI